MNCEDVRDRIGMLADGELEGADRARVEAHLDVCPACREALADLRALHVLLGADTDVEPSSDFAASVRRRLTPPLRAVSLRSKLLPALAAAAAVALLLTGLILVRPAKDEGILTNGSEDAAAPVPSPAADLAEVEKAVEADPELLEILNHLELLDEIEILENLSVLEKMDEIQVDSLDDLAEEADRLLIDPEIPVALGEVD